jgi:hypothetical protein
MKQYYEEIESNEQVSVLDSFKLEFFDLEVGLFDV